MHAVPGAFVEEAGDGIHARSVESGIDRSVQRIAELAAAEPRLQGDESVVRRLRPGRDRARRVADDRGDIGGEGAHRVAEFVAADRTRPDLLERGPRDERPHLVVLVPRRPRTRHDRAVGRHPQPLALEPGHGGRRVGHREPRAVEFADLDRRRPVGDRDVAVDLDGIEHRGVCAGDGDGVARVGLPHRPVELRQRHRAEVGRRGPRGGDRQHVDVARLTQVVAELEVGVDRRAEPRARARREAQSGLGQERHGHERHEHRHRRDPDRGRRRAPHAGTGPADGGLGARAGAYVHAEQEQHGGGQGEHGGHVDVGGDGDRRDERHRHESDPGQKRHPRRQDHVVENDGETGHRRHEDEREARGRRHRSDAEADLLRGAGEQGRDRGEGRRGRDHAEQRRGAAEERREEHDPDDEFDDGGHEGGRSREPDGQPAQEHQRGSRQRLDRPGARRDDREDREQGSGDTGEHAERQQGDIAAPPHRPSAGLRRRHGRPPVAWHPPTPARRRRRVRAPWRASRWPTGRRGRRRLPTR